MISQNKSLTKGLQVLKEIMNSSKPVNANFLCTKLDIDKSTMSRLITTLISEGFIKYVENSKEIIYADVIGNISKKNRQEKLKELTINLLNEIFIKTNECAYITVYDEECVLNLNQIDNSTRVLKNTNTVGIHTPLHANAFGKVILAHSEDIDISKLELNEFTYNTIISRRRLKFEISNIKEQGYAIEDEEYESGLRSIAIPLFSTSNEFLGAIGISGLAARLSIEKLEEFAKTLLLIRNKYNINI